MGNGPSQNQSQSQNMNMNIKKNIQPEILEFNEDEIFEKILNISNQLFDEYNNDFLKDDFCSKIALIYEKKLSNFNIKRVFGVLILAGELSVQFILNYFN